MRRSLLAAALSIAALTFAANRPIPERVRESAVQALLSIGRCTVREGAPAFTNPIFEGDHDDEDEDDVTSSGRLATCEPEANTLVEAARLALSVVAADKTVLGRLDWNDADGSYTSLAAAEAKLLGRALATPQPSLPNGAYLQWDPVALEAAFDAYYVKPTATLGGLRMQQLYDALLKPFVSTFSRTLAIATHTPGLLPGLAAAIREGKGDARDAYMTVAQDLQKSTKEVLDASELGWIVRRELDGTLPLVRRLLATVAKDYDPAALKVLDDKSFGINDGKLFVRVRGDNDVLESVTIDGVTTSCDRACPPLRVAPGKHKVMADGASESTSSSVVEVTARTTELVLPMQRTGWSVTINTNPPNLQFTVDGVLHGRAPQKLFLKVGERQLDLVDPCVEPKQVKLVLGQTEPAPVVLEATPKTALLRIDTVDFDGNVIPGTWTLDGQPVGAANTDVRVPLCSRALVVSGPLGRSLSELLVLDPAATTARRFVVTEPPRPGPSDRSFDATWTTLGRQALAGTDRAAVRCPRLAGKVNPLWGDGVFTDDSSVCAAARFRGRVDASGGTFFIRRAPGRDSYAAGSRNGVDSRAQGKWSTSFEVE